MTESTLSVPMAKRKRTDDGSEVVTITRSTIWFDDGSIILQAAKVQFRVHKSVLSRNSSVFRDMFNVPQPKDEPTIDGCAIVHVSDDAEDWKNVFEILYDNVKAYKSTDDISFSLLKSMLRLGKKYEIDHLQAEGMNRLKQELPVALDLWAETYENPLRMGTFIDFDLINLLLELGIKSLIPVAYYAFLQRYKVTAIVRGAQHPDDGTPLQLWPEAKESLLLGYTALSRAITINWATEKDTERCRRRAVCSANRSALLRKVAKKHSPMRFLCTDIFVGLDDPRPCGTCHLRMLERIRANRRKVWDSLPTYFGLPAWKDLRDD